MTGNFLGGEANTSVRGMRKSCPGMAGSVFFFDGPALAAGGSDSAGKGGREAELDTTGVDGELGVSASGSLGVRGGEGVLRSSSWFSSGSGAKEARGVLGSWFLAVDDTGSFERTS